MASSFLLFVKMPWLVLLSCCASFYFEMCLTRQTRKSRRRAEERKAWGGNWSAVLSLCKSRKRAPISRLYHICYSQPQNAYFYLSLCKSQPNLFSSLWHPALVRIIKLVMSQKWREKKECKCIVLSHLCECLSLKYFWGRYCSLNFCSTLRDWLSGASFYLWLINSCLHKEFYIIEWKQQKCVANKENVHLVSNQWKSFRRRG